MALAQEVLIIILRAKNHNSDKLTHEEDEVYEDFESNSQIRSDDVGDQDDHDEISLDDNLDGYVCSNLKNFQYIKFIFKKFFNKSFCNNVVILNYFP